MFEFKGDWTTVINLEEFSILDNPEYCSKRDVLDNGIFTLQILDVRNENPDPEPYQINAINYLLDTSNQKQILKSLLHYSRDIIYPHYKQFMWEEEYPDSYPRLETEKDLYHLLGVNSVIIKTIEKDDFAYFIFTCNSCLDYEHGITITLYKNEVIDHGEDWDDQKVCAHKGIDYKTYEDHATKEFNKRDRVLTSPHPKYEKLKPWQEEQNDYYPFGLYHDGQFDRLISEIEDGTIKDKDRAMLRLFPLSIYHEKERITQYLIPKFGPGQHSAFKYALQKDRYDLMNRLITQGYDINQLVAQDSVFYDCIWEIVKSMEKNQEYDHIIKRFEFLLQNGLNPLLEDKFGRNAYYAIGRIENLEHRERVKKILEQIENA